MRIVLTGASGFIGCQALAALVVRGADVHAVSRRRPDVDGAYTWHRADLLSPGEGRSVIGKVRPDCILHLAWCVEHGKFWTDPANLSWVSATLDLARAAAEFGVSRFVGAGTCYEYDWPPDGVCVEDMTPLIGHTLYDISKDGCRRLLSAYLRQGSTSFAWGRLFFLYGPGETQTRLVASIARALVAGEPASCSQGLVERDFMDVRDAGDALAALAMSDVEGVVNIGTGEASSIAGVATTLGRLAGRPDLVKLGILPDRPGEPPRIAADIRKLREQVGYPGGRALEAGLSEALSFWREMAGSDVTR